VSSFKLIDAERADYPVALLCRMLGVSKSGYYAWRSRPPSERRQQDALLTEKIREIHSRSRETYGYPRVHAELRSLGIICGRRRVARLMRAAGLRGCMRGKRRKTTRRDPRAAPAPDLLRRDFVAGRPNRVWLADITYIPTQESFLYLAFILEAVMNSIRNSLGMRETEIARDPNGLWNPHFYAIFAQVHNTL
jgi:putative transposase